MFNKRFQNDRRLSTVNYEIMTSPFHGENTGSIPVGRAKDFNGLGDFWVDSVSSVSRLCFGLNKFLCKFCKESASSYR